MSSKVFSGAVVGLDAQIIEIETDVSYGLRSFTIVGLPDKTVEESKERVGAAIKSTRFQSPHQQPQRILVNLAPADLKKEGSLYDLPVALGYLLAAKQINFDPAAKLFAGELALDGTLRPIKGVLALTLTAKAKKYNEFIVPKENALEAALVSLAQPGQENINELKIIGARSLKEVIEYLEGKTPIASTQINPVEIAGHATYEMNFGWIKGQEISKRALEIAAAGGHNVLMQGPPGAGKSLLARALPSILPPLNQEESLEVTKIYSVTGLLPEQKPLIGTRPFRSPHHTTSEAALIGGGNPPKPGEITLAHRGVLFLDEFPEFHRDALESLRQPIEEGVISILRARDRLLFPARFTLIAAANPCPCGYWRDPMKRCQCTPSQIAKYQRKLSGPLIDRIDLFLEVPQLKFEKLTAVDDEYESQKIRERVITARHTQKERFKNDGRLNQLFLNSEMEIPHLKKYCQIDEKSKGILKKFVDSGKLSMRGYHRVLKVARTIADLAGSRTIGYAHITEALMYRVRSV